MQFFAENVAKLPQKFEPMATINYEIGKPKQDGTRKIIFVLSHKGKRKRIPSNISVGNDDISRSGKITSRKVQKSIDDKLKDIRDRLYDLEADLMDANIDLEWIYSRITNNTQLLDFFSFTEQWVAKSKLKGARNYPIMLNSLERFCGGRTLLFSEIDYNFLNRYLRFLEGHPRAQSLYLGNMRHMFNEAMKEYNTGNSKLIPSSPFEGFKIPKDVPQTKDRVVDVDTLVKIFSFDGSGRPGLARDCYVLSFCLMGMNSVDLYDCTEYKDGVLSYERVKTRDRRSDNAHIEISVPRLIVPLMEKYKGRKTVFNFCEKYSNPSNFNKHINTGLHIISDKLRLPRFDFYSARHTWASIARNKLGIDKYTIHEALNHVSQLDITDIYIQKDYTNINKANAKVMEYITSLLDEKSR